MLDHNNFNHSLENEIRELTDLRKTLLTGLADAPEGSLIVNKKKNRRVADFYWWKDKHRTYIPKSNLMLIQTLARKSYFRKLLKHVDARLESAAELAAAYEQPLEKIFTETSMPLREKYLSPIEPTDAVFVSEWYAAHPGSQNPYPISSPSTTNRGEIVRSKSEKILADLFDWRGIPYVYEPLLSLKGGKTVFPDFILLNIRLRRTFIFEHFGVMSDGNYSERVCEKMNLYLKNGFLPGRDVLFSMESAAEILNTQNVHKLLDQYLL